MVTIVLRDLDRLPLQSEAAVWAVDAHAGGAVRLDFYGCITAGVEGGREAKKGSKR